MLEDQAKQTKSTLESSLPVDRYTITITRDLESLVSLLIKDQNAQDCLIIFKDIARDIETIIDRLATLNIFIPTIIVLDDILESGGDHHESSEIKVESKNIYQANISISVNQINDLPAIIDQAIATFIKISAQIQHQVYVNIPENAASESLSVQQQRLSEKLNERLGYLGVYYKRDSRLFLRNLSPEDRKEYIGRLKNIYRSIVLEYFLEKNNDLNQQIDEFVNLSFFADISVSQVLEIHMELMDEFAKQLRLEGRNDEILLDYRITLIDMIAHLCELYRRSIPRS
ncbi:KaiA family protein [Pseudanabaena biceps]|nr:KaiA family protein [Pseudanabaena biceps]